MNIDSNGSMEVKPAAGSPEVTMEAFASMTASLSGLEAGLAALTLQMTDVQARLAMDMVEQRQTVTSKDVQAALEDLGEVYQSLIDLTNKNTGWSRADVGVACYLFNFMLEIGFSFLTHVSMGVQPATFSKQSAEMKGAWPVIIRDGEEGRFVPHKPLNNLPEKVTRLLTESMKRWMPYHASKIKTDVVYTKVGFWMHALRAARNASTHRSLAMVRAADPVAVGDSGALGEHHVKVPINPALEFVSDTNSHKRVAFSGIKEEWRECGNGFCLLPVGKMMVEVREVAKPIKCAISEMIDACRPPLPTTPLQYSPVV